MIRPARSRWVALVALTVAAAALADPAYSYLPYRMLNTAANPFPYYVDSRTSGPGGVTLGLAQAAADSAWNTWNQLQCAAPKVISKGLTGSTVVTPGDPANGYNTTPVFVLSSADPDYSRALGHFVTGITVPLTYSGVLLNCNIFLNASDYQFSTGDTTPSGKIDVQSVMLHEAGHCLGLNHYNGGYASEDDVMIQSIYAGMQKRVLTSRDVGALCEHYPVGGAVGAPCYDGGTCDAFNQCYTQSVAGSAITFCSRGCDVTAGEVCPLPLVCTASTAFPGASGGCLMPTGNVTPVGKACTKDLDCVSAVGECLLPEGSPSGHQYWAAGYCSQKCEAGQPACPAGSTCTLLGDNSHHCLASCRPGFADCRTDYACLLTSSGGVCAPMCYTTADCQDTQVTCRTCDGVCVSKQNPSAAIGDLCNQDSNCGAGQTCTTVSTTPSAAKQCTQQCGQGCAVCPLGSSCVTTLAGLNCLRECTGPNTCPSGLRCADFPSGKGCVPMCTQQTDCPVGQDCLGGECLSPLDDGGCGGTLCMGADGGKPIQPTPKDAGTGKPPPISPCGCEMNTGSVASVVLAWALIAVVRRLRWRKP